MDKLTPAESHPVLAEFYEKIFETARYKRGVVIVVVPHPDKPKKHSVQYKERRRYYIGYPAFYHKFTSLCSFMEILLTKNPR